MNFVLTLTLLFVLILPFATTIKQQLNAANDNDKHLCGGDGWVPFPKTRCIKLFFQVGDQSHKSAKEFCAFKNGARLVTVQSAAEQAAIEWYLSRQNAFDLATLKFLWLDGSDEQYNPNNSIYNSSVFHWGSEKENQKNLSLPLTFSKWARGQPVKPPLLENNATCIQMHVHYGMWSNEPCSSRNAVVCMRKQRWSREKVQEVVEWLVESQKHLVTMSLMLEKMQREIEKFTNSPVPIGFIYVQLPKEKRPQEIWSSKLRWTDISSSFESTFFRVAGSKAAKFGIIQEEFSPYIDEVSYENCMHDETYGTESCQNSSFEWDTKLDRKSPSSWSERVITAHRYFSSLDYIPHENNLNTMWTGTLKFHRVGGEVRPRNMAVKVWKRTG